MHSDLHSKAFENVGAAAEARKRPVAVLGDLHARARDNERRDRRNVEGAAPSPPVPQVSSKRFAVQIGDTLVDRSRMARAKPRISSAVSPFIRKRDQKRRNLRRGGFAVRG